MSCHSPLHTDRKFYQPHRVVLPTLNRQSMAANPISIAVKMSASFDKIHCPIQSNSTNCCQRRRQSDNYHRSIANARQRFYVKIPCQIQKTHSYHRHRQNFCPSRRASNKVSYSRRRDSIQGNFCHSKMYRPPSMIRIRVRAA